MIVSRSKKIRKNYFITATFSLCAAVEKFTVGERTLNLFYPYHSPPVPRGDQMVGILRLSDVFEEIYEKIKPCEL
jgi:hypothetical protein